MKDVGNPMTIREFIWPFKSALGSKEMTNRIKSKFLRNLIRFVKLKVTRYIHNRVLLKTTPNMKLETLFISC